MIDHLNSLEFKPIIAKITSRNTGLSQLHIFSIREKIY